MFLGNKLKPKHNPPGCNPLRAEDRMPILKVVSGDTWVIDADLVAADGGPAYPGNSHVDFVLAENQFSPAIWTGTWNSGIVPDENRAGLVHVKIPRDITKTLRRGSYMFSMRVSDLMRYAFNTQLKGSFLVEYMPTSDQHSIPYRDGTSEVFGGGSSGSQGGSGSSTPTPTPGGDVDVSDVLKGKEFDFTDMRGVYTSLNDIINKLGGKTKNFPSFQPNESSEHQEG